MKTFICTFMCFALFVSAAGAQDKKATGLPKPAVDLQPGAYHYQVKLEVGGQVMNLKSSTTIQDSGNFWTAIAEMEMPGGAVTDTAIIEKTTLILRKRHLSRDPVVIDLDFSSGKATGKISVNGQENSVAVDLGGELFADGAGANEAIASLPLAVGYSTTFRNLDIQTQKVKLLQLNVAGSESVTVPAGKFDTFRVDITSADEGSDKKTIWVAKDTRKVVKGSAVVAAMGGAVFTAELLADEAIGSSAQENRTAEKTATAPATSQAAGVVTGVKIAPDHVTLTPGQSNQFTGTVDGTGSFSTALKWSVNEVDGGNAALGSISSDGLYVTPYPTPAAVTIKARSTTDPAKSASVTIAFAAPPVAIGPALLVDAAAETHPISPLIYGMNSWRLSDPQHEAAKVAREVRLPLNRWGGDADSRYNYKLDVTNSGDDWFFEIIPNKNTDYPDVSEFNSQVIGDRTAGAKTMGTVPVFGWVAKTRTLGGSFSVAKYGAQQKADPYWGLYGNGVHPDGSLITNNDPNDTCMPIDESWSLDWVKYLVNRFGNAASGGVAIYSLDNEPTWWDKVHRDVHPLPFTYDEVTEKGLRVAKAIKAADPTAEVSGPVIDYWLTYFYSKKDVAGFLWGHQPDAASGPTDRKAHGNLPLIDYYLRAFKAAQDADPQHTRYLDYLDLHTYFAAGDAMLKPVGTSKQQRAVIDSTRVFWDPTYIDPIFRDPDNMMVPLAPQMIPRMKKWVANNYPGTKTAITEYNWGAPEHISGAVAQADILGIFGREGLDLGALWGPPNLNEPLMFAFKIFRNYDDAGGEFGDLSVAAKSADQGKLAVYAARRTADHAITVVVINKTFGDLRADLPLDHFKAKGQAKTYQYSGANLTQILALPKVNLSSSGEKVESAVIKDQLFPAMSITLYAIPGN
ncbi:MAG: glycoside hydrolase family 44 protein [Terracidiphilus sp.]|jgi:hypothetical protein